MIVGPLCGLRLRSMVGAVCLGVAFFWAVAPCAAQPVPDAPHSRVPRYIVTDLSPGVRPFAPERWGIVGVTIQNPTDRPADVLSSHYFSSNPERQFARQLWIPPRARRTSWYPVLPPDNFGRPFLKVESLLIDRTAQSGGNEVLLPNPQGTMTHGGLVPAPLRKDPVTGLIADDLQARLPAMVARVARKLVPGVLRLYGPSLLTTVESLPTVESLQGLDQLIVSSDRPAADAAGLHAIRSWLHGGGRLWVMLDRTSPATVSLLLGEDFPCTVVDRVGLTEWQFRQERRATGPDDEGFFPLERPKAQTDKDAARFAGQVETFEPPVEMVRILAPGVKTVHSINGWPVSFWRPSGRGQVLFTTLGPRGWVKPRARDDKERLNSQNPIVAPFQESEPLRQLAAHFLLPYEKPTLPPQEFAQVLSDQIGYRIVGRGNVLAVLSTFCLGLAAAAGWLVARGRTAQLAHLGWIGPTGALMAAVLLVALGFLSRSAVPATVAELQLVEAAPGALDAPVSGLLALYNQEASSAPLGAEQGGIFLPDAKGQVGVTHRMVWTDLDRWHVENLSLAGGQVHAAPFATSARLDRPLSARVTFGPDGVLGQVALGPFQNAGDAVLALPSRRNFAVRFALGGGADGAFTAGPGDQLAPDQFLAALVLSAEQRRRQAVYQRLLNRRSWPRYPMRPMFFTWADPLDLGFTFAAGAHRAGSALVAIPLAIERPTAGTQVLIPGPFLTYHSVTLRGSLAALYDPKHNEWVSSMRAPAKTRLRFQIPPELLPLHVERATLTVDINAQARPFEVFAGQDEGLEVLPPTYHSPVGRLRIPIDRPNILQPDAAGGVYLGISVGAAEKLPGETSASSEWKIDDLQLELAGRTLEP